MACNTKHGPACAIRFFEKATGVKLTQTDWHLVREATEAESGKLRRTRVTPEDAASAFMELANEANRDETVPTHEVEAARDDFMSADNTEGTLAMLRHIAANGLPASVTERKRRGDGKPRSHKADTDNGGVDRCPACGEFSNDGHSCPPERLREYAVAEDTNTAELYERRWMAIANRSTIADHLHYLNGEKRVYGGRGEARFTTPTEDTVEQLRSRVEEAKADGSLSLQGIGHFTTVSDAERYLAKYHEADAEVTECDALMKEAAARYDRFTWSRAFLVVTNGDGHVHSTMACSTCYPTTRFNWLPSYSGSSEDQIVGDAGERACTVCYPSAPVDVLARPTKIFSEDEKERQQRRVERDEAKAKKAADKIAKAPTASGEPLTVVVGRQESRRNPGTMVDRTETFNTERAATIWATDQMVWGAWRAKNDGSGDGLSDYDREAINVIVESIALKRGVEPSEVRAELEKKADAKKKREGLA